jgi:hypothetical protein
MNEEVLVGLFLSVIVIVFILEPLFGPSLTVLGEKFRDKVIGNKKNDQ